MHLILALGRQRLVDFCEFKASLGYRVSSRPAGAIGRERPCLKKDKNKPDVVAHALNPSMWEAEPGGAL